MGAVFLPAVLTGARRSLSLVVEPRIRCRDEGRMTFRTESPADETIKLGRNCEMLYCGFRTFAIRNSQFEIRNSQSLT